MAVKTVIRPQDARLKHAPHPTIVVSRTAEAGAASTGGSMKVSSPKFTSGGNSSPSEGRMRVPPARLIVDRQEARGELISVLTPRDRTPQLFRNLNHESDPSRHSVQGGLVPVAAPREPIQRMRSSPSHASNPRNQCVVPLLYFDSASHGNVEATERPSVVVLQQRSSSACRRGPAVKPLSPSSSPRKTQDNRDCHIVTKAETCINLRARVEAAGNERFTNTIGCSTFKGIAPVSSQLRSQTGDIGRQAPAKRFSHDFEAEPGAPSLPCPEFANATPEDTIDLSRIPSLQDLSAEQLKDFQDLEVAELLARTRTLEIALEEERQQKKQLRDAFATELMEQRDAHTKEIQKLGDTVAKLLAKNQRLTDLLLGRLGCAEPNGPSLDLVRASDVQSLASTSTLASEIDMARSKNPYAGIDEHLSAPTTNVQSWRSCTSSSCSRGSTPVSGAQSQGTGTLL